MSASSVREATEVPELQSKLEKLDEERSRVQEELKRLQMSVALDADDDEPQGNGAADKARVRFSSAGASAESSSVSSATPSSERSLKGDTLDTSGRSTGRRLSTPACAQA